MFIWDSCLQLWYQHPWLGVGWGNLPAHFFDGAAIAITAHPKFASNTAEIYGGVSQAHNIILQFLVEGGVVAASALLLLFVALGRKAHHWGASHANSKTAWICSIIMLTHGMVSVTIMEPFFMVILATSLAACFINES